MLVHALSLLLLIAQFGIEAHAYSHLKTDSHGLPNTSQACLQCLASVPLSSMVGGSASVRLPHLAASDCTIPTDTIAPTFERLVPAFRSRAPPTLL